MKIALQGNLLDREKMEEQRESLILFLTSTRPSKCSKLICNAPGQRRVQRSHCDVQLVIFTKNIREERDSQQFIDVISGSAAVYAKCDEAGKAGNTQACLPRRTVAFK